MNKLEGFPTVFYVTLEEDIERQNLLTSAFKEYNITPIPLKSKKFTETNDVIIGKHIDSLTGPTRGCITSHIKAINQWYSTTKESYGFFCEDDLSLETIQYWNFTWKEFIDTLPDDWEAIQLSIVRGHFKEVKLREREWDDWSQTAYILKRSYAKKLLDSYIKENSFCLEVEDLMPIGENILFTPGKTYSYPLFVENTNINSTDVNDPEIEDGQKPNHHYASNFILNWWKKMEDPLVAYVYDTENPQLNFNLALWYENQGQTASAISFFLRTADRTNNLELAYECLLHLADCFHKQSNRNYTVRGLYQHASTILPKRPEAYYLLAKHQEWQTQYAECYTTCCTALNLCDFDLTPLSTDVGYPGKFGILFQKAISAYWWGKGDESRKILQDLKNNYNLDDTHYKSVGDNLMRLASNVPEYQIKYDKSRYEKVRYKFDGLENVEQNYSQIFQDMFILCVLNGKKNGTYLEIGAQQPFYQSNTALLETKFGWKGVSVEIKEDLCKMFLKQRKNTILCQDATQINYQKLLEKNFDTKVIDYLQVDIEPSKTTFEALLSIPFDEYKFAIITYEHDHYVDMTNSYRTKSRKYLELMGYELVVSNVSGNDFCPFEDWWVHPDLVDRKIIEKFKSIQDVTDVRKYFYK
jgi:GR25 family glycosyltransferase involved in LPS biosynthesis